MFELDESFVALLTDEEFIFELEVSFGLSSLSLFFNVFAPFSVYSNFFITFPFSSFFAT